MLRTDEQRQKAKETIKAAWDEGDLVGVLAAGFDHFMQIVSNGVSMPFAKFLEYTGISFDRFILETCKQKGLNYIGGTMVLKIAEKPFLDKDLSDDIYLSADFYFQTAQKAWVMQKKRGHINSSRFSDWTVDPSALELQRTGELKLSIEPPEVEAK